jgi:hypothetical protein
MCTDLKNKVKNNHNYNDMNYNNRIKRLGEIGVHIRYSGDYHAKLTTINHKRQCIFSFIEFYLYVYF